MKSRTKINITLAAFLAALILIVVGVMQRRANPGRLQAEVDQTVLESRTKFAVEDLLAFASQTPIGPFPTELISADLEARTGATWFFERHESCWRSLQTGAKGNIGRPTLTAYKEPNQPEPLLVLIEFESGEWATLKFVQDAIVSCDFN